MPIKVAGLNTNYMTKKTFEVIVSDVNTYKIIVEALSEKELREAFNRGDVNYTEGQLISSNSQIEEINNSTVSNEYFNYLKK